MASGNRHRPLDGLRGVAVLAVILVHSKALPVGWMGVDLFFALSGFLITGIVLDAKANAETAGEVLRPFYARRALRIFPLAYATLVIVFLVVPRFAPDLTVPPRSQALWWLYLSNMRSGAPGALVYLRHFWSLAVEEQFYVIWPAVVLALSPRQLRRVCIALIGVAIVTRCALTAFPVDRGSPESFTLARLDGLVAGALVASLLREPDGLAPYVEVIRRTIIVGTLATEWLVLAAGTASSSSLVMRSIGLTVVGVTAAAIVAEIVANPDSPLAQALSWKPLCWFGTVSYGLYVIHAPVALLLERRVPSVALAPAVLQTSTALAAASWYWFESPILSFKRRFPMPDSRTAARRAPSLDAPSLSLPLDS